DPESEEWKDAQQFWPEVVQWEIEQLSRVEESLLLLERKNCMKQNEDRCQLCEAPLYGHWIACEDYPHCTSLLFCIRCKSGPKCKNQFCRKPMVLWLNKAIVKYFALCCTDTDCINCPCAIAGNICTT